MKFLKAVSIILFISFIAIGCGSGGGENPPTTTVSGTVLDGNGVPIEGAKVTINSTPVSVYTDSGGNFSATVEIGTHTIEIRKDSVLIHSGSITCKENIPLLLSNIPTDYILIVGTWDLSQNDGVAVPSGTSTLVLTATTFSATRPNCIETGTYTADGSTITSTTLTSVGSDCDVSVGTIDTVSYTVNSTTLTTTHSIGGYSIWKKLGSGNPALVGEWEMTDIQGVEIPSELPPNAVIFTDLTYTVTIEGDCGVSGIYTSDVSSIWLTSTSRTGNTDGFCDYHDTPHRLGYSVTSSTLIITEGDVVIKLTRQ